MEIVVTVFLMITVAVLTGIIIKFGKYIVKELKREDERRRLQPICGCTHNLSFHDRETGRCNAQDRVETDWNDVGTPIRWGQKQCSCVRYTGPEPIISYYAPEITSGGEAGGDR